MSGGIYALQGFVYQATVTLDVLLQHFRTHGDARARPEGVDDLELVWIENGDLRREFIQIKKASENEQGPTLEAWSLTHIAQELLPDAITHLRGNTHTQRWILGDGVASDAWALIQAGTEAPTQALPAYLQAIHLLAREASDVTAKLSKKERQSVGQWHFDPTSGVEPDNAIEQMVAAFQARVTPLGVTNEQLNRYTTIARARHQELPGVLGRIRLESTFGIEEQVRTRVCDELARRYPIIRTRVEDTIFGNIRAFIDDVATHRDQWIGRDELDALVARVWPEMLPLREPPPLPDPHVERHELLTKVLDVMTAQSLEVIGVAGSGKTTLARSLYDHAKRSGTDVLYVEVRRRRTLREILAAVAFHLRRQGIIALWDEVTRVGITEEERTRAAARALENVAGTTVVLVDLVEGSCDDEFARLLAEFIRARPSERFTLAILGQESALRGLSSLEREQAGIPPAIEQIGFHFDDFAELVGHFHASVDRERLWYVFQRQTAGRVAGLFARLAYDLARSPSIEAMERLVGGPPEQAMPRAVRDRFHRLDASLRPSAEKLTCFLLPFRLAEAVEIFPEDRIQSAARELLGMGLLHHHDSERLEMHETVRRSLQDDMPPVQRREAHEALAQWYEQRGELLAEIHHLDSAGRRDEAHHKARETYLAERHLYALTPYVVERRLITNTDLIDWLMQEKTSERVYLVPNLLRHLGDVTTAEVLLDALRARQDRFDADFQWAWLLVESILACDPGRLYDLVRFGLEAISAPGKRRYERLKRIAQGARRGEAPVDQRLLALFEQQGEDVKFALLDILVLDPRREVLEKVLPFVETHEPPNEERRSRVVRRGSPILLPLRSREEIVEFLAAVPLPNAAAMTFARSPMLGRLAELVWVRRSALQPVCIELLETGREEEVILKNALRVLIMLGDIKLVSILERYYGQRSPLGTFVMLVPAVLPFLFDNGIFERRLLDRSRDIELRIGDLHILTWLGADLGRLLKQLLEMEPERISQWHFLFLFSSLHQPFTEAVPLLEQALSGCADERRSQLFASLIMKLGELSGECVTDMLIRALSSAWRPIRMAACIALQTRRSPRAFKPLLTMCLREGDAMIAQSGIVALIASGPADMEDLAQLWSRFPAAEAWRYVLADRLHATSEASLLVTTAIDSEKNWQLRRIAILAASRLPFHLALAHIAEPVLRERSSFTLDTSHSFLGHEALCLMLGTDLKEQDEDIRLFVQTYGSLALQVWYDSHIEGALSSKGAPDGATSVNWLHKRVLHHGGPARGQSLDRVLDELHIPILHAAVLRGLRLAGRFEAIESIIRTADNEWLLVRTCSEWTKERTISEDMVERLRGLVAGSRFPDSPYVQGLIRNVRQRIERATSSESRQEPSGSATVPTPHLRGVDVLAAITTGQLSGQAPFRLSCSDESELRQLIAALDPANDYTMEPEVVEPSVTFIEGGITVGGIQLCRRDNHAATRAALRPAVAAANRAGIPMPWHVKLLSDSKYLSSFVEHLGAMNDADRFYQELSVNADQILPRLNDSFQFEPIRKLIDERIVPYLSRYSSVGTDGLLEVLCAMAGRVDAPSIDSPLALLFDRWIHRFDLKNKKAQHDHNTPLWRAFGRLRSHPRFLHIPNYDHRLIDLLLLPLRWFHKNDLVSVVLESPRSYTRLEMMLFKAAPFEHWFEDDVDRLDAAAEALFHRVLED